MILIIIGIIVVLFIVITPSMMRGGGTLKYTLAPYKPAVMPLNTKLFVINKKWKDDTLPMVVLDAKQINISIAEIEANPNPDKLTAAIFEPPASLTAPCFYDEKTLNKYIGI